MVYNTHYTKNIPATQFWVFHVSSQYGSLGLFQTWGQAYEKISEEVNGRPLVEISNTDNSHFGKSHVIKYAPINNLSAIYSINRELFTYKYNFPLIEYQDIERDETQYSSVL